MAPAATSLDRSRHARRVELGADLATGGTIRTQIGAAPI